MLTLQFFLDDDRYRTPTLMFVEAANKARARNLAADVLGRSEHYRGVDGWAESGRLFGVGSCADAPLGISAPPQPPTAAAGEAAPA